MSVVLFRFGNEDKAKNSMKINLNRTSVKELERLLSLMSEEDADNIISQIEKECKPFISFDLWQLNIEDFGIMCRGEIPEKLRKYIDDDMCVKDYYSAKNALCVFLENFSKMLDDYAGKQTAEQRQAAMGLPGWNDNEGLLVFALNYFSLHSFSEAEKITLADVYLAKKDVYLQNRMQSNLDEIYKRKYNRK